MTAINYVQIAGGLLLAAVIFYLVVLYKRIALSILLMAIAIYLFITLLTFDARDLSGFNAADGRAIRNWGGLLGARLSGWLLHYFGYSAYLIVLSMGWLGWRILTEGGLALRRFSMVYMLAGGLLTLIAASGLADLMVASPVAFGPPGGHVGTFVGNSMTHHFTPAFSSLFVFMLLLAGISLTTGWSWLNIVDRVGALLWRLPQQLTNSTARPTRLFNRGETDDGSALGDRADRTQERGQQADTTRTRPIRDPINSSYRRTGQPVISRQGELPGASLHTGIDWRKGLQTLKLKDNRNRGRSEHEDDRTGATPSNTMMRSLLKRPQTSLQKPAEPSLELRQALKAWLQDFGMEVDIAGVQSGPVITRFELDPAPGLKAHQISQLGNDLVRGLSVALKRGSAQDRELLSMHHIRVVEITPGKSTVMLEVPNNKRPQIYLGEIIDSSAFNNSSARLPLALGKDFDGEPVVIELDRVAHLLLAGAAGSGLSVALKTMLISILCKIDHARIEFLLIDPAMLELSVFKDISSPPMTFVSTIENITSELSRCVDELKRRNRLLAELNVANIDEFNRKVSRESVRDSENSREESVVYLKPWPFKVIMVADLADFMAMNTTIFEDNIELLARRGRAVGMHMILATQRPSSDVINNRLKSNIPCRIAFQMAAAGDSRHVLDQPGAEALLGQGDMLLLRPGQQFAERVHGAMVDSDEIKRVVEFLGQSGHSRQ